MARSRILTDLACDKALPAAKPRKLPLGEHGVYLLVLPSGGKYWRMKYRFARREKLLALGVYPRVKIADQTIPAVSERQGPLLIPGVRTLALQARQHLQLGLDPMAIRKEAKTATRALQHKEELEAKNSLQGVSEQWLTLMRSRNKQTSKNAGIIEGRLRNHVFPRLGKTPITSIRVGDIDQVYSALVEMDKTSTANRIVGYLVNIFDWANSQEPPLVITNTARRWQQSGVAAPEKTKHHPALTSREGLERLVAAIYTPGLSEVVGAALKLLMLTFVRPGNLLQAEWDEFDFDKAMWVIPLEKMKCKDDSREDLHVPLSPHAIKILLSLRKITGQYRYVFTNPIEEKPISGNALRKALTSRGITNQDHHLHGFRATASTRLREDLDARHEYIELQLHHRLADPNRKAYNRASHLKERRAMMIKWSELIETVAANQKRQGKSSQVQDC